MGGRNISQTIDVAAAAGELALDGGRAPSRIKLLPMGAIALRDGRGPFRLRDRAHAEQVVAATRAYYGAADMPGDYDHQTLAADPINGQGGRAPASAWIKTAMLSAEDDGIWADDVRWTPAAAAAIEGLEYRYISPLFRARPPREGGDVVMLRNFALVGTGAIDSLPELIAAGASGEQEKMDLTAIAALLGLGADAGVEEIAAAITEIKNSGAAGAALETVAAAAGLRNTAAIEEIAAGVRALRDRAANSVPASVAESLRARLDKIEGERIERRVDELVAAGVVTVAERGDVIGWYRDDEAKAEKFFANRAPLIAAGAAPLARPPAGDASALTAEEQEIAAAIGWDADAFLAAKKKG